MKFINTNLESYWLTTLSVSFYKITLQKSHVLKKAVGMINLFEKCVPITKLSFLYKCIQR